MYGGNLMDFFKFCQKCKNSVCCSKPFYAFVIEREYEKIIKFCKEKKISIDMDKVFLDFASNSSNGSKNYLISKKDTGQCIFLGPDKRCLIEEVKPLDCLFWPLTFDYSADANQIIIYLGDCLFVREIKKTKLLKNWIETQKTNILKGISNYSKADLIAYTTLPNIFSCKKLSIVALNS